MYKIKRGLDYAEYPRGKLYHCDVISIETSERVYRCYGTTRANAARRACDFIREIETS